VTRNTGGHRAPLEVQACLVQCEIVAVDSSARIRFVAYRPKLTIEGEGRVFWACAQAGPS